MAEYMAIEIAELIETGLGLTQNRGRSRASVIEQTDAFLEPAGPSYCAGPLGLALIAATGDPQIAHGRWRQARAGSPGDPFEAMAQLLGISGTLARLVQLNHRNGVTALEIAQHLRTGTLCMASGPALPAEHTRSEAWPEPLRQLNLPAAQTSGSHLRL